MGNNLSDINPVESVKKSTSASPIVFDNDSSSTSTSFTLLFCNAYLIPTFGINIKNTLACTHKDQRAEALGLLIKTVKPDIVALAECWGAGLGALESQIANDYEIEENCKTINGSMISDTIAQKKNKRGGLYFAHRNNNSTSSSSTSSSMIKKSPFLGGDSSASTANHARWYNFQNSLTTSNKGVAVAKYQKMNNNKNQILFVFNCHLDPTNDDNVQVRQLREIALFVNQVLVSEAKKHVAGGEETSNSSNHTNKNDSISDFIKKSFSAVIVGDFNFNHGSAQYKNSLFREFQDVGCIELDEILSKDQLSVSTFNAKKNPFMYWGQSKGKDLGRIDLIFGVKSVIGHSLKPVSIHTERVIEDVYVSDHFPFVVQLKC